jgi:YHS domain-containing protein
MIRLLNRPLRAGYPLLALAGLAPLLVASAATASDTRSVVWRTDLGTAQAEARARDLPLWIQFTGPWCVNCRRMERGAFVHPAVVASSQGQFVPVKLRSDEYEQLALSLGLNSLPSTVIVRPNGEVIDKWEGYGESNEFHAWLQETLSSDGRLGTPGKGKKFEVAMAAFCPVALVDRRKLVPGLATLTAKHDGFEYRFADEASRTAFLARPEKYVPANHGECPVEHVENGVFQAGKPQFGVIYRGHLYLFAGTEDRTRFLKNPERYANVDLASRHSCPHCWGTTSRRQIAQVPPRAAAASLATRRIVLPPPAVIMEALLMPVNRLLR